MNNPNPHEALKGSAKKQGRGLRAPAPAPASTKKLKPEHAPATEVAPKQARRSYRVSTAISAEHGQKLEQLIAKYRAVEGKKSPLAVILERGIDSLYNGS